MVESCPSLGRCLSIRGGWQLAQLRFERVEIDGLRDEFCSAELIGAAPPLVVAMTGRPGFQPAERGACQEARSIRVGVLI